MSETRQNISASEASKHGLLERLIEQQEKNGYLSEDVITEMAREFDMPVAEVYGVASFYTFLSTKPLGRNVIRICKSVPCYMKDSQTVAESLEKELGIKPGETTVDKRFSLELTNCIGACDHAPAMLINHDVHGDLKPGKIASILARYK